MFHVQSSSFKLLSILIVSLTAWKLDTNKKSLQELNYKGINFSAIAIMHAM